MTYFYEPHLRGATRFDRFMQVFVRGSGLARAVIGRAQKNQQKILELMTSGRSVKTVSLACGPAFELEQALRTIDACTSEVELVLIDQDEDALRYAVGRLRAVIQDRPEELAKVKLRPAHLGVRQILRPGRPDVSRVVDEALRGYDLIYAAGLFDYLSDRVARLLIRALYRHCAPGGRLSIGNLRACAEIEFLMEYVGDWQLIYREPAEMLPLAEAIHGSAEHVAVDLDDSGFCRILDITKFRTARSGEHSPTPAVLAAAS